MMRDRPESRRALRAAGQRPTAPRAGAPAVFHVLQSAAVGGTIKRFHAIFARPPAVGHNPAHVLATGGPT